MHINDLIVFAQAYANMGTSVHSQLEDFLDGERRNLNVNAMDMCADLIKKYVCLDSVVGAQDLLDDLNHYCLENS